MATRKKTPTRRQAFYTGLQRLTALPRRYLDRLVYLLGWIFLSGLLLAGSALALFFYTLPDVGNMSFAQLQEQAQSRLEEKLADRNRSHQWVPLRRVNRDLLYAVVMAEDARFFQHQGIDYNALLAALVSNLKSGETRFGGSTLSQQTVKNLFLSPQQSYFRKLQEAVLTRALEAHFSKNQILELYLNMAEFGPDIYGVVYAGRYYFNKQPADINAAEGAWLSLLLPSPRRYHYSLYQNRNLTTQLQRKYRRILRDMRYEEFISARQYQRYLKHIEQRHWPAR